MLLAIRASGMCSQRHLGMEARVADGLAVADSSTAVVSQVDMLGPEQSGELGWLRGRRSTSFGQDTGDRHGQECVESRPSTVKRAILDVGVWKKS
jgi:hypothetical protein